MIINWLSPFIDLKQATWMAKKVYKKDFLSNPYIIPLFYPVIEDVEKADLAQDIF